MQHDRTVFGAAVAAGLIAAPMSEAMPPVPEEDALDFSGVNSMAEAEELVEQSALVKALFFPARYGGTDHPENMGYLPVHVLGAKEYIEDQLEELATKRGLDKLVMQPTHDCESIVPNRIVYMCSSQDGTKGEMAMILEIW